MDQRIRDLAHTLIAGLPSAKRYHHAAQLDAEDHARLVRLLKAVMQTLPLGLPGIARRILGKDADTPGIAPFIQAAGLLRVGRDNADLRAAADALGQAALDMGLDRFKPFLREADEHLAARGALLTLVRDLPQAPPPVEEAPIRIPNPPMPGRAPPGPALLWLGLSALPAVRQMIENSDVRSTIERFGLDVSKPADVTAAYAFLWAENQGPWIFDTPQTGPDMQAMAERVMRFAQAYPNLFTLAATGDADAQKVMSAAVKGPAPGSGIETRNDEERTLVAKLTSAGKTAAQIQTALDQHRARDRAPTARERRNAPGVASMSTPLPAARKGWLLAGLRNDNGAAIPGQIAEKLVGLTFRNFGQLRRAIWLLVGQIPELADGLNELNLQQLQDGHAPFPPREQQVTIRRTGELSKRSWELHHAPAIVRGGPIYDLSTLRVVTPRQHDSFRDKDEEP